MMRYALSIGREHRLLFQFMPNEAQRSPEQMPELPDAQLKQYMALSYPMQMAYMQNPYWVNQMAGWQVQSHMHTMPSFGWQWYAQGGMPFNAFQQNHYVPYGYFQFGQQWNTVHPAWMYQGYQPAPWTPPQNTNPPRPRIWTPPRPEGPRTPPRNPTPPRTPTPPRIPPATPRPPEAPRLPSHPLDVGGRLAQAYTPYLTHADPVVRATALRWWGKAIQILERHPGDTVLFNQLVRGAADNLGRATTQYLSVRDTRALWEARQPRPQVVRVRVGGPDPAGAITISRAGSSDRVLYYPNKSAPFWDMRSMDVAREWGLVPVCSTYETGEYPRSMELRFYGPGSYTIAGVAGVVPEQADVSVPPLATGGA